MNYITVVSQKDQFLYNLEEVDNLITDAHLLYLVQEHVSFGT